MTDDDIEIIERRIRYEKMCAEIAALPVCPSPDELRRRYLNFLAAARGKVETKSVPGLFVPDLVPG